MQCTLRNITFRIGTPIFDTHRAAWIRWLADYFYALVRKIAFYFFCDIVTFFLRRFQDSHVFNIIINYYYSFTIMSSDRTPLIGGEKEKPKSNFAASCSNFSIQYNLAVASVRCAVVRTLLFCLLHETETHDFITFTQVTTNSLNLHVHHYHLSVSLCSDWDLQVAIPMMSRIYVPGQTTNHTNHTDEFTEANDWFGPAGETPPLSHNSSNPMSPLYVLQPVFSPPDHLVFFTAILASLLHLPLLGSQHCMALWGTGCNVRTTGIWSQRGQRW